MLPFYRLSRAGSKAFFLRAAEDFVPVAVLKVANRNRERVRRVGSLEFLIRKHALPEDRPHHTFHLFFLRTARARDRLLHERGGIFEDVQVMESGADDRGAARLPELERALRVLGEENFLYRHGVGPPELDHLTHGFVDHPQARSHCSIVAARLQHTHHAVTDPEGSTPSAFHAGEAEKIRSGVDAEHSHEVRVA